MKRINGYPPSIREFLRSVKDFNNKWLKSDFIDPTIKPSTFPEPIDVPDYLPNVPTPGGL